jgi:hypothetical protein
MPRPRRSRSTLEPEPGTCSNMTVSAPASVPRLKHRLKASLLPAALVAATVMLALVSYSLGHAWRYDLEDIVSEYQTDLFITPIPNNEIVEFEYLDDGDEGVVTKCVEPDLGSYDEVKIKLNAFDFIEQASLAVVSPLEDWASPIHVTLTESIMGFDPELNDHLRPRGMDGRPRSLQANEVLMRQIWGPVDSGDLPVLLRLKDGDSLRICNELFIARFAPEPLLETIGFGDYTECMQQEQVRLILPMAKFRARESAQPLAYRDQGPLRLESWCPKTPEGRVKLIKIKLKPAAEESLPPDEAERRLKESFGEVNVRFASRPLGELPVHVLAGLNMLITLSYLLWPGLALGVFIHTARRHRETRSGLGPEITLPPPRLLRWPLLIEIIGPSILGISAGIGLAILALESLGRRFQHPLFGGMTASLRYHALSPRAMLLLILVVAALAFAITLIAALVSSLSEPKGLISRQGAKPAGAPERFGGGAAQR